MGMMKLFTTVMSNTLNKHSEMLEQEQIVQLHYSKNIPHQVGRFIRCIFVLSIV